MYMSGSRFGTLAQGFISGAVVTASISYSLYQRKSVDLAKGIVIECILCPEFENC